MRVRDVTCARCFEVFTVCLLVWTHLGLVTCSDKIPLGAIFEQGTDEVQSAFKFAMLTHNQNHTTRKFELQAYVDVINTADAFKLSRLICNQFSRGVFSMLGAVSPDSFDTFHSYSNTFQMPFITPWFPEKVPTPSSGLFDYAISMRPDYHQAIIDTVKYYGWKSIIYMYDSHDGLLRLQQIYQSLKPGSGNFQVITVKRIQNVSEAIEFLHDLETLDRWGFKHIVLDCATDIAKSIVVTHVRQVTLGKRTYHYLLSGLIMDERWETEVIEYGAINITGFRLINSQRPFVKEFMKEWNSLDSKTYVGAGKDSISAQSALMYDAVLVIVETFNKQLRRKPDTFKANLNRRGGQGANNGSRMDCNPTKGWVTPWEHGDKISKTLRKVEIEGLTGDIRFNNDSKRMNYTLDIVEMTINSAMVKVAAWSDVSGLVSESSVKYQRQKHYGDYDNKTYLVTSIMADPYLSFVKDYHKFEGNARYEGYCKDLADLIANKLKISYEFRVVTDGKYGKPTKENAGEWDGMMGALMRREVDMAVAPLTITTERERVVDFSKPFMTLGLSIMMKKPSKMKPGVFSFLDPLSEEIWVAIIFSYIMVSVVLFLVSRFSPHEWRLLNYSPPGGHPHHPPPPHHGPSSPSVIANDFSLSNSLWFSLGALLQQGTDISPRSISGRIVGAVWWFFTLILVSSYTANLAAFLTVERMVNPINSVEDLADQSVVKYGVLEGGASQHFFQKTTLDIYQKMYHFMMANRKDVFVGSEKDGIAKVRKGNYAFLVESPTNDYTNGRQPCNTMRVGSNLDSKGFGVATPIGSPIRNDVNMAILNLLEEGNLTKLQKKWFEDTSECKVHKSDKDQSELALSNVAGVFYILGVGLLLAMAVALIEFCYNTHMEASSNKVPVSDVMKNKARMTIGAREFDNGRVSQMYYASGNTLNPLEDQVHSNTHTQV
uniref:Glutamate receptor 1 n=5 Tax=Cacopsylla melanoneura TaxID=428564 RepID=A0A8D8LQ99_9HEMI